MGRWPSQRHGTSGKFAGQLQSPSARIAPHPELPALLLAKLSMRRGGPVCAPLLLPGPSTSHWLRPHDQNWLSFFDRYHRELNVSFLPFPLPCPASHCPGSPCRYRAGGTSSAATYEPSGSFAFDLTGLGRVDERPWPRRPGGQREHSRLLPDADADQCSST